MKELCNDLTQHIYFYAFIDIADDLLILLTKTLSDFEVTENNTRLFVSGLYDKITENDIRNHFESFGTLTKNH